MGETFHTGSADVFNIAYHFYRRYRSRLNASTPSQTSRGLRHLQGVEGNIYLAAHTGVSAMDFPPPFPAPSIQAAMPLTGIENSVPEADSPYEYTELLETGTTIQPSGNTNHQMGDSLMCMMFSFQYPIRYITT